MPLHGQGGLYLTMAKDPAFLFYSNDYIGGTMGFTLEMHGAYLLTLLFQFNSGHFTENQIKLIIGDNWNLIKHKFLIDNDGFFYNTRLDEVKEKRIKYSESRRNNRKHMKNICKTYVKHMGNGNGNRNKDLKDKEKKDPVKKSIFIPPTEQEFFAYCKKEGLRKDVTDRAWKYYTELKWHDSQDKPIKSWKAKLQAVWVKEENKERHPVSTHPFEGYK